MLSSRRTAGRPRPHRMSAAVAPLAGLVALLGSVLAGCSSGSGSAPADAGAVDTSSAGEVLTVRIATNDSEGAGMSVPIDEFARQVAEASGGRIEVVPQWDAGPPPGTQTGDYVAWDQYVARRVVDGEFELGIIPARAWDTEGVTTLRALYAPFLIDTNEVLAAVVADEALAGDLMGGLDGAGVTGLSLVPESLRHLFAYGDPLISVDDFAGASIRAPRSITTYALFEALGATPDDPDGADFERGALDGSIDAAESSLERGLLLPGGRPTAIANVTPFANVNSLVANRQWFESLDDDQRRVLADAADATRQFMVDQLLDETVAAADYCTAVGDVVNAGEADLAAIVRAATPVEAELRRDPTTAGLIDRIEGLKAEVGAEPPTITPCRHGAEPAAAAAGTIPVGRYGKVVTREAAEDLGVDPGFIDSEIGDDGVMAIEYEFTADNRWVFRADYCGCGAMERGDFGDYSYDDEGNLMLTSRNSGSDGFVSVVGWSLAGPVLTLAPGGDGQPDPIGQLFSGDLTRSA